MSKKSDGLLLQFGGMGGRRERERLRVQDGGEVGIVYVLDFGLHAMGL